MEGYMKLIDWAENKINQMNIWDIGFIKMLLLLVGMIIGAYISEFIISNIFIFAGIAVFLYILITYKFYKK